MVNAFKTCLKLNMQIWIQPERMCTLVNSLLWKCNLLSVVKPITYSNANITDLHVTEVLGELFRAPMGGNLVGLAARTQVGHWMYYF